MKPQEFAKQYCRNLNRTTANEKRIIEAIEKGEITPDMSLRQMGLVLGMNNPQLIRHYLEKFANKDSK